MVKAHIIPRKFFSSLWENSTPPSIYHTKAGTYPRRSPTGIYDSSILCGPCDGKIGIWDQFAQKALLNPPTSVTGVTKIRKDKFIQIKDLDYEKMKLFCISLLWRSHLTENEFFAQVDLGPWAAKARELVYMSDPGSPDDFSVLFGWYDHDHASVMRNPERVRNHSVNCYRFRISKYVILIKVDRQPLPGRLQSFALAPDRPLLVSSSEFLNSKEYESNIRTARGLP